MQIQTIYLRAGGSIAELVSENNVISRKPAPSFVRGQKITYKIVLFADETSDEPCTAEQLARLASSWGLYGDVEYEQASPAFSSSSATVDENGVITVLLENTNSARMKSLCGANFKTTLHVSLVGTDSGSQRVFTVHFDISVYAPVSTVGLPGEEIPEEEQQDFIEAITSNGFAVQFSVDGSSNWHSTQATADRYFRFGTSADGGVWSAAIRLAQGEPGASSYTYVAYASSSAGADFALRPTNELKYRAEIHVNQPIDSPSATDFASATWVKYIGDDGVNLAASYTYVAYASDNTGNDFSLTPTDSLKYRAEIHVSSAITTPTATDFASATWVKYIGDDGTSGGGSGGDGGTYQHTHAISDITNLQGALDGKAESTHTHAISDVTGLQNALDSKAGASHSHAVSNVTGLQNALDGKLEGVSLNGVAQSVSNSVAVIFALPIAISEMPSPSASGQQFILYLGTTDENYTKGHLYERTTNQSVVPPSSHNITLTVYNETYQLSPNSGAWYGDGVVLALDSYNCATCYGLEVSGHEKLYSEECTNIDLPWEVSGWHTAGGSIVPVTMSHSGPSGGGQYVWTDLGSILQAEN